MFPMGAQESMIAMEAMAILGDMVQMKILGNGSRNGKGGVKCEVGPAGNEEKTRIWWEKGRRMLVRHSHAEVKLLRKP